MAELTHMALLFAGIGTAFVILGIWSILQRRRFIQTAAATSGVVVELEQRRARRHSRRAGFGFRYHPVVEFTSPQAGTVRFTSGFGSSPAWYKVGQPVQVLYDPGQPERAEIQSGCALWFASAMFVILGGVFACIGWAMLVGLMATGQFGLDQPW